MRVHGSIPVSQRPTAFPPRPPKILSLSLFFVCFFYYPFASFQILLLKTQACSPGRITSKPHLDLPGEVSIPFRRSHAIPISAIAPGNKVDMTRPCKSVPTYIREISHFPNSWPNWMVRSKRQKKLSKSNSKCCLDGRCGITPRLVASPKSGNRWSVEMS